MDNLVGSIVGVLSTGVVPVIAYGVCKFIDRLTK